MALQKTFTFPNGQSGNYIRIGFFVWDRTAREASVHFHLFTSQAFAESAPKSPICLIAKLRLKDDKFDQYLSTAALEALTDPGPDPIRDQLYAAAKVEPLKAGGEITQGALDLSDSIDV